MAVYDREWYRKEQELRRRRQEGADAMWEEVERSHRKKEQPPKKPPKIKTHIPKEKLIPCYCPHCDQLTNVCVSSSQLKAFSYVCPSCKKKITVKTETIWDKKVSIVLFVIGLIVAFYLFMYFTHYFSIFRF